MGTPVGFSPFLSSYPRFGNDKSLDSVMDKGYFMMYQPFSTVQELRDRIASQESLYFQDVSPRAHKGHSRILEVRLISFDQTGENSYKAKVALASNPNQTWTQADIKVEELGVYFRKKERIPGLEGITLQQSSS